jgi:hypothetical protein
MVLNKNIKLIVNYFLGPVIFLLLLYVIYLQLIQKSNWQGSLQQIEHAFSGPGQWKMWMVFLLMIVNWGLEAKKWQISIAQIQPISFWRAFKATLTGSTMASFTPNRMGEYLGRILYVKKGKRIHSIALNFICSMAQIIITLLIGCWGILYLQFYPHEYVMPGFPAFHMALKILFVLVLLVLVFLVLLYFRLSWLVMLIGWLKLPSKYLVYVKILERVSSSILLRILLLSFLRYCVFIVQYFFLFDVFGVSITWWQTWGSISVVFLIMTIVPTFTLLTELGLKWEASIQVVQLFSGNTVGIFVVSFGIWMINLVIPALVGSLLILGIKFFKK